MSKAKGKRKQKISAKEFDRRFDEGESVVPYLSDIATTKQVLVDFPLWMVKALDREAARLGIARLAVIKMLIDQALPVVPRAEKPKASRATRSTHQPS